jgi:DNA-binding NarL/FixJ family response regulator
VQTIRIALLNMKPMLRDMLTGVIAREQDMELMDCHSAEAAELAAIRPDVLVCEMDDPLDLDLPRRLLAVLPRARVLVVADAGDHAAVCELRPTRKVLLSVSIEQVIDAIRFGLEPADGLCGAPERRIRQA